VKITTTYVQYRENGVTFLALLRVISSQDINAAVRRLVDRAVPLVLAAADAVNVLVWLGDLHKRAVARASGTDGSSHVVLSTAVVLVKTILCAIDTSRHLDPIAIRVDFPVGRLNEPAREEFSAGRRRDVLSAECDCSVLVVSDLVEKKKQRPVSNKVG